MVTCGSAPNIADLAPVELIPASDAQSYVHPIANALCGTNQAPVYLVHDGTTGTSDDIVADAENALKDNGTFEGVALFSVIHRLAVQGNSILIWWANNNPLAYKAAEPCSSVEELMAIALRQTVGNRPIQVYLPSNPALKRDPQKRATP